LEKKMRNLIGKVRDTAEVDFMGSKLEVVSLTVSEIRKFQKFVKEAQAEESEDGALGIQRQLIRMGVVGAEDMTDEELDGFPIKALADLSRAILEHNGLNPDESGEVGNAP
jgi:hypothetical protein